MNPSSITSEDIIREAGIQAVFDAMPYSLGGSTLYPVREKWHLEQLKQLPHVQEIASATELDAALASRDDDRVLVILPSAELSVQALEARLEHSAFSHILAFLEAGEGR